VTGAGRSLPAGFSGTAGQQTPVSLVPLSGVPDEDVEMTWQPGCTPSTRR
jgi:hypothetical protein